MKKVIEIEGMSCGHCQARVENALNGINGVQAKVDLKKKQAIVTINSDVDDLTLKEVVTEAGYDVISITEKKGLFSK
jgi:Copper chaperone